MIAPRMELERLLATFYIVVTMFLSLTILMFVWQLSKITQNLKDIAQEVISYRAEINDYNKNIEIEIDTLNKRIPTCKIDCGPTPEE